MSILIPSAARHGKVTVFAKAHERAARDRASMAVELDGLSFAWPRNERFALDIGRLTVDQGERLFVHGPSGCGKSTLLNLLAGVLTPTRGSIRVLGFDIARLASGERDRFRADHIGMIFQQFNLIPYLPIVENVLLACRFSQRRRERAASTTGSERAEAERLLARLDLAASLWKRRPIELSVGQQQRVALARALIGRPEIVIADEPTSALDDRRQRAFLDLLSEECEGAGASLVYVSHDRSLAGVFEREIDLETLNRARTD
jgi:putative ABC transport system ATP-binding protein